MGNIFYYVVIVYKYVGIVVNYVICIVVKLCRQNFFGDSYIYSIGNILI